MPKDMVRCGVELISLPSQRTGRRSVGEIFARRRWKHVGQIALWPTSLIAEETLDLDFHVSLSYVACVFLRVARIYGNPRDNHRGHRRENRDNRYQFDK